MGTRECRPKEPTSNLFASWMSWGAPWWNNEGGVTSRSQEGISHYVGSNKEIFGIQDFFLYTVLKFLGTSCKNEEMLLLFIIEDIYNNVYHRSMLQTDEGAWKGVRFWETRWLFYDLTAAVLCFVSAIFLRCGIIRHYFSTCPSLFRFLTAGMNSSFP